LPNSHPVSLGSVPALIAHSDEAPGLDWKIPHHQHEIGQRLKVVALIGPKPNVERTVLPHVGKRQFNPLATPCDEFNNGTSLECDKVVWGIVNREGCEIIAHQICQSL